MLALDFDPANTLGLALGAGERPADGIAVHAADMDAWSRTAMATVEGIRYVPFGQCSVEQQQALALHLPRHPDWLGQRLQRVDLPDDAVVLFDTPRRPSVYAEQAIALADVCLEVLQPDVYSYALLSGTATAAVNRYVINGYDARRRLHGDLRLLLEERLGSRLCPFPVHGDEALSEALASDRALAEFAPDSQIARDIDALARWLLTERPA